MSLAIHAVSDAATPDHPSSAVAISDGDLGFSAAASATVGASLLDRDLGAVACQLVLETVRAHLSMNRDLLTDYRKDPSEGAGQQVLEALRRGIAMASREAHALARRRRVALAVTLDAVLVLGQGCFVGHVGDGRVYLVRKGLVHKLTQDHVDEAAARPDRPDASPLRARLSSALRQASHVSAETLSLQLSRGDRVLLTSPHLHRGLDDLRIREVVTDPVPDGVTARLLGAARANGIAEDMAVALVDVGGMLKPGPGAASRLATLARIPLFAYCTERELLAIAGVTRPIRFRSGSMVFREGDPGQGLFLVVDGKVAVIKEDREITRLGSGANFGEMSMLDEPRRSASVKALEDTELLLITRDAFFSLLKRDPNLAVKVLWNMLLRISANLRATSEALAAQAERSEG